MVLGNLVAVQHELQAIGWLAVRSVLTLACHKHALELELDWEGCPRADMLHADVVQVIVCSRRLHNPGLWHIHLVAAVTTFVCAHIGDELRASSPHNKQQHSTFMVSVWAVGRLRMEMLREAPGASAPA